MRLQLQVHRQALDMTVDQYVDVEQRCGGETVAVEGAQYPLPVHHQIGHEQRAREGAELGQPWVLPVQAPLSPGAQLDAGAQILGASAR
ncbi:hypothetical protein SAZ_00950 [Streptomyces noursei ZPM]|nr:hypothetical protein SAZ_00950 [Streptomyces noursei ZPM]EPY93452.1 hypothetical protein K530_47980 [Streptomyces noursei CCRC 11814]EXU91382.1 hypothetical protein P354_05540 [Streptomyces noursei PD-1]